MFLVLLLANAAFFGWAHWIDVPAAVQAGESAPALPVLALAASGHGAEASMPSGVGAATAVGAAAATAGAGPSGNGGQRCRTLGPFPDAAAARAVADVMRTRGLSPRGRTAHITLAGGTMSAYWLDVDLGAGMSDPPLAALRRRLGSAAGSAHTTAGRAAATLRAATVLRGVAFSDCPAASTGG